jgi:hypothetical protein
LICPKDSEFFGFEFDPEAAILLFDKNGGLNLFNSNGFSKEETSVLIKPISVVIKDKCIASYQSAVNYDGDLFACGGCGVRSYFYENHTIFRLDDPKLLPLQLIDE